jgi:hypothetical protein
MNALEAADQDRDRRYAERLRERGWTVEPPASRRDVDDSDFPPVCFISPAKLGQSAISLGMASIALGHQQRVDTIRDYVKTPATTESAFLHDLLLLPRVELADEWYGGVVNAAGLANFTMAEILARARQRRQARMGHQHTDAGPAPTA